MSNCRDWEKSFESMRNLSHVVVFFSSPFGCDLRLWWVSILFPLDLIGICKHDLVPSRFDKKGMLFQVYWEYCWQNGLITICWTDLTASILYSIPSWGNIIFSFIFEFCRVYYPIKIANSLIRWEFATKY